MATPFPSPSTEAHSRGTPSPGIFSRYSWNPSYDGLSSAVGATILPTNHIKNTTAIITYDDHGYADDVNVTADTIQNMKIQLQKLHLFSQYIDLQLETTQCEAKGAL